ncbi:cytochrome P450 [Ascodesmis nigricans]|uniref:Cytochrome P450 n=1 Tax=Ascodesmis nigricans TaxID=341454 RepID=A0A4S2MLN4_9PEZI|nr:cytochrome P450 [Ascodesmis nigricans]
MNQTNLTFPAILPSLSTIVLSLPILLLATWLANAIYNIFFHPLSHIPGPFWGKITNFQFILAYIRGRDVEWDRRNFESYGDVYRTAPNLLVFSNPAYLPLVYHRHAEKGDTYLITAPYGLIALSGHREHAAARKRLQAPFTVSAVRKTAALVNEVVDAWVTGLGEAVDELHINPCSSSSDDGRKKGKTVELDFTIWPSFLTYDVLTKLCFGKEYGFCRERRDLGGLVKAGEDNIVPVGVAMRLPVVMRWVRRLGLERLLEVTEETPGMGEFIKYRDRMLKERLEKPSDTPDILNHLLKTWNPNGAPLSETDITQLKEELLGLMTAGTDTSAQFLRDLIYQIGTHPDSLSRLYSEIPPTPSSSASPPPPSPYLTACILETLRLHAPATFPFPRTISSPGLHLGPHFIPPCGSHIEIYASALNIGRSREVFGEDAEEWRPERWVEAGEEVRSRWEKASFAWGFSARGCVGRPVAEVEIEGAVRGLLGAFVVEGARVVGGGEVGEMGRLHVGRRGERVLVELRRRE